MNRPVLYTIPAFDARSGTTIKFAFTGSTIIKSEAIFYNSDTGVAVYGKGVFCEGNSLEYKLPANVLANSNVAYYVKIRVFDENNNVSSYSEPRLFYCVESPLFYFKDLNADGKNTFLQSSHIFSVAYDAGSQNEELNFYSIYLYDDNKTLISTSNKMYEPEVGYEVLGLVSKKTYYIRAIGETKNGMAIDTSYVELYVEYTSIEAYAMIKLTNRPRTADIAVQSNIKSIDGTYYTGEPEYVDSRNGQALVLLEDGQYVIFDDGVNVSDIFDIEIALQKARYSNVFLVLYHDKSQVLFTLCKRDLPSAENGMYVIMMGTENGKKCRYTIQSNIIDYQGGYVRISIKREKDLWSIFLQEPDEVEVTAE